MKAVSAGIWALVLGAAPLAAAAKPQVWVCDVNAAVADGGLMQPRYLIRYEPGAATAEVFDGLIKEMVGKPVTAKAKDDVNRTVFSWKFIAKAQGGISVPVVFTGALNKADLSFRIQGTVSGGEYRGGGGADGVCKVAKD